MSGQGWDETNRNTSESKAEGKLFASLEDCRGVKREGRTMHRSTYNYTPHPTPPPSIKREAKAPSLNTKQQHYQ